MAGRDNTYSRFVYWSKILLPMLALGLLATLFLFSEDRTGPGELPFSEVELEELARGERMGAPRYAGLTEDGAALEVRAQSIAPDADDPGKVSASDVAGRYAVPGGVRFDFTAATGTLRTSTESLALDGGVRIDTSTGYRITADSMAARLDQTRMEATGNVAADGPPGRLTAGRMLVAGPGPGQGGYVLVFKDGVKLVYEPKD